MLFFALLLMDDGFAWLSTDDGFALLSFWWRICFAFDGWWICFAFDASFLLCFALLFTALLWRQFGSSMLCFAFLVLLWRQFAKALKVRKRQVGRHTIAWKGRLVDTRNSVWQTHDCLKRQVGRHTKFCVVDTLVPEKAEWQTHKILCGRHCGGRHTVALNCRLADTNAVAKFCVVAKFCMVDTR